MYETHFGMRARPFRPGPDPAAYYAAAPHDEALATLGRALADDEPFVALTGETGVGKTLVLQKLLERIGDHAATAVVTNSHFDSRAALLQAILYDLGLTFQGRTEQELRLALTDHLLEQLGAGKRTIVLIDEAHHLSADCLEELRLLANLESRHGRAVQIVLIGLSELIDSLQQPWLRALAQRLTTRVSLGRLNETESAEYLRHQVRAVGGSDVFGDEAIELIVKSAQGVPRVLNQAAHQSLVLACQSEADRVDAEAALEALARLGIEAPADEEPVSPAAEIDAIRLGMTDTHRPRRKAAR